MSKSGKAEMVAVIGMSFASGIFVISAMSYFARGGQPLAWIDVAVAVILMIAALINARRMLRRLP
jgi:hypothetical protein